MPSASLLLSAALVLLLHVSLSTTQTLPLYTCLSAGYSRRALSNYGGIKFQLSMTPPKSAYLEPNMDCGILIVGYSTSRWLITMDSVSMNAFQAQFTIQDSSSTGKQLASVYSNGTVYRQVGTTSGSFYARINTKGSPNGLATGVRLTIEKLSTSECPSGWYTGPGSSGYCYGVPKLVANLTYDDATKGCNLVLANLVMGNFDYDSITSELRSIPLSVLDPRTAYWVGLYEKEGELKFLNKYNTLNELSGRLCPSWSSSCNCVAYQNGKFYRDDCTSQRPYVCYMPKGGTSSFYDITGLISSASVWMTVMAIVLTVIFILSVVISLIIIIACCLRRKAALRRSRAQNATYATASADGVVTVGATAGYPNPPPYPVNTDAVPPYTIYCNVAFDANGTVPSTEKPPAYDAEWSGQQVPS